MCDAIGKGQASTIVRRRGWHAVSAATTAASRLTGIRS